MNDITIRPFYQQAEDAIRQPHRGIVVSAYLLRWVPEIGADGLVLLLWLRMASMITADCRTTLPDLARETGTSVSTLKRILKRLERAGFLHRKPEYRYRPDLGKKVRCGIVLRVRMDDPLRPEDQEHLAMAREDYIPWDPNTAPPPGMILIREHSGAVFATPMERIARIIRNTGASLHAMYDLDLPGNDGRLTELENLIGQETDLTEELEEFFSEDLAQQFAARGNDPEEEKRIRAWVRYTKAQPNLRNPAGFLRRQLESGNWPPGYPSGRTRSS